MPAPWTAAQLDQIATAQELEIASRRSDGSLRPWTPIWAVVAEDQEVYVRTWHRRETGWYGRVLARQQAGIRVPGLVADVTVEDVGGRPELRAEVDAAYRAKYGAGVERMVGDEAAGTTLRLRPVATS